MRVFASGSTQCATNDKTSASDVTLREAKYTTVIVSLHALWVNRRAVNERRHERVNHFR